MQNRLTIDFLLDLWERESPGLALVIYGRQHRPVRPIRNVVYAGFVGDISEAYAPGSIMLCPVFLPGGIKTKILESFAHGTPVVGNRASFEGLALPDYPLCFEGAAELAHFLRRPGDCEKTIRSAINIARQCLQSEHSGEIFQSRWEAVVGLSTVPEAQNPGSPEWR